MLLRSKPLLAQRHAEVTQLQKRQIGTLVLLATTLVILVLVYRAGLDGPFVFDDYPNIVDNPKVATASLTYNSLSAAALSRGTGISSRPLALLSFALNSCMAHGTASANWYKLTNLVIHLINTILIFWLSRLLLSHRSYASIGLGGVRAAYWLPPLVAATWGLHPLNLHPVLYVVQRMTSLSTLFMLAGIVSFVIGRQRLVNSPRRGLGLMIVGAAGGVGLGLLSKEIALLVPLYLLVIEITFFDNRAQRRPVSARWFHGIALGTLTAAAATYLALHYHEQVVAYDARAFTLAERLLTETRVLWFYASLVALPIPHRFGLFHDDIAVSTSLISPWTTLPATLGLIAIVSGAVVYRRRWPLICFAVLWFVVGHAMESSVIGLEIAHEHRNYLPSFGPLFAIVYGLTRLVRSKSSSGLITTAMPALFAIAVFSFATVVRVDAWASESSLITTMVHDHPNSPRSLTMRGEWALVRRDDPLAALQYYRKAMALAPNEAGIRLRAAIAVAHPVLTAQLRASNSNDQNRQRVATFLADIVQYDTGGVEPPKLQHTFVARTTELLRHEALSADSRQMLVRLGQCLADTPRSCASLSAAAMEWYSAAAQNPHIDAASTEYVTLQLFNLAIDRKDYPAALRAADRARARDPANATYDLMRANAFILMNRYDDAAIILDAVMQQSVTSAVRENVATLQDMLERRRNGVRTIVPR